MIKSHVIKLYPTKSQEVFFNKSCGVARFAYNWGLSKWKEMYEKEGNPSAYTLIKNLTAIKRQEYPWMLEVGKSCPQYAIYNLEKAFKSFFKKTSKHPKFHKKGVKDSFVSSENFQNFKQKDYKIWIPRLGWVKCAENLRFEGKVNNVVIKRTADLWFAVVNIDVNIPDEIKTISENQAVVGVDLGIKHLAVTSNGMVFENPKALKKNLRLLKIRQKSLSRKQKGSNNKRKQQTKVARLHYKISCIRNNALHNTTTAIVNSADIIVLEDLNVKGMIKNRKLAQSISDVSFGEFRRQIEYKAKWQGKKVIVSDRFFASSKTCSCCGWKKEDLKLKDRVFVCESCGTIIDRDLNASYNLASLGSTEDFSGSQAFGVGSSASLMFSPTMKDELNN